MVSRAHTCVLALALFGCNADTPQPPGDQLDQLDRIEARLERIDERLRAFEHTVVTANAVEIQLPEPAAAPALSRIAVSVTPSQVFINDGAVATVALRAELEKFAAGSPHASIVIQADQSVEHGRVVEVMDTIKKAGFTRIAIATLSEP